MTSPTTELRHALDPVTFAIEALGITPDPWQSQVLRSTSKRLLLCCSRQVGKSTIVAVAATHQAVFEDGSLVLIISPSQRQSGETYRKITGNLARLGLQDSLIENSQQGLALANGSRVISLPAAEDRIRGYSKVDLLIEDEAARVDDGLYGAARPMLAVSNGRIFLMSTPAGCRGHFFRAWTSADTVWERVQIRYRFPADQCRLPRRGAGEPRRANVRPRILVPIHEKRGSAF